MKYTKIVETEIRPREIYAVGLRQVAQFLAREKYGIIDFRPPTAEDEWISRGVLGINRGLSGYFSDSPTPRFIVKPLPAPQPKFYDTADAWE